MFYEERMKGILNFKRSVQIGIRTEYDHPHPYKVIDADFIHNSQSINAVSEEIKSTVTEGGLHPNQPVYLTFDIDALDPAFAPGTGTPVCGGLSTAQALQLLRGLSGLNIVGADVVEVNDYFDHANITALAAASLGLEILYLINEGVHSGGTE